ncbi:hypothetical protein PGB90_003495 [Kerria lacca]
MSCVTWFNNTAHFRNFRFVYNFFVLLSLWNYAVRSQPVFFIPTNSVPRYCIVKLYDAGRTW